MSPLLILSYWEIKACNHAVSLAIYFYNKRRIVKVIFWIVLYVSCHGNGGEHEKHEDPLIDHDTVPHEEKGEHDTAPHQEDHGASLMEQGHEATSHEVPAETHDTAHEEWGSALTEEFPVSQ